MDDPIDTNAGDTIPMWQWFKWLEAAKRYDHNKAVKAAIKAFKPSGLKRKRQDLPIFEIPPAAKEP